MHKTRNFIFLALLAALFFEVLIVFPRRVSRSSLDATPLTSNETETVQSEQLMKGVHLVESQQGRRDWELFSSETEGGQGVGTSWTLKKVRVLFYTKEKVEFIVVGDEGSIDAETRDMSIRGNVVTTSANQYVFQTQDVTYRSKARLISSSSAVTMLGPKDKEGDELKVTGQRMQILVDTGVMTIPASVEAFKKLNTGMKLTLNSDTAEFSGRSKEARFVGHVQMNYDPFKIEGAEVRFIPSIQGQLLSNVQFLGGVKIKDADKFATSESLNFDFLAQRLVLKGQPKVYQNGDELSGDQIIFLDGGKKVKVEKIRAESPGK